MESTGKVSDVMPSPEASILAIADSECPEKEAKAGSENKARFRPSDEELVTYYLKRKVLGESVPVNLIPEIDVYKYEPWDLAALTAVESTASYFFCSAKWLSTLAKRKTPGGYWIRYGSREIVKSTDCLVGYKIMLRYRLGVPSKGTRTDWAMYEYQLHESVLVDRQDVDRRSYLLFKILKRGVSAKKMDHTPQKSTAALSSALTEGTEGSYTLSGFSSEKGPDSNVSTGKGESYPFSNQQTNPRSYLLYKILNRDVSANKMDHTPQKSTAALSSALTEGTEGFNTLSGFSSEISTESDFSTGKGESYPFSKVKFAQTSSRQSKNTLFGLNESEFEQSEMTGSSTVDNLDIDIGKNQVSDYQVPVHDQMMTSVLAGSDDDAWVLSSGPCTWSDDDIGKNLVSDYQGQAESSKGGGDLSQPKMYENDPIENTAVKILEALTIDECRRICLYGKRGIGKTTVLKALFDYPATKNMFEQVILVSVPRFSHEKKILDDIVHQLSLTLNVQHSNSDDERRHLICQAFMSRKLLLLLDDVHKVINLHEIGVPEPGPENNHCLVVGTSSPALCHGMKTIHMESISVSDAWELLHRQVGDVIDSPQISPFALNVAHECCYSPLIISAVGSALAAQSTAEDWRVVSQIQGSSKKADNDVFSSPHIQYCYDRLKAHDLKTCFLYCALLLDHKQIHVSVLAKCIINEGLLGGTTVAAFNRAKDIIGQLIKACLLEANDETMMVKMHNVIRDSAFSIFSSSVEGCQMFARPGLSRFGAEKGYILPSQFLINVGDKLKEPPPLRDWEQASMIFLMDNEFSSLPSKPSCPTLVSLFLQRNRYLRVIPASFFSSMCTLTNLDLSKTRIRSLPSSLFNLKSLQVLFLRDCEHLIMLPPAIGQLKALQVLDLQGTELIDLPDTISELSSLKSFKVSFYGPSNHSEYNSLPTKLFADGIISSLQLEELGMFVYPGDRRWTLGVSVITKEVSRLMLSSFYFHFAELENLDYYLRGSKSWNNGDLKKFNIIVGHDFKRAISLVTRDAESMHSSSERCLRFVNGETIPHGVVEVLKRGTSFYLDHHLTLCYLSEFEIDNMDALRICILSDCPKVQAIINYREDRKVILPSLEYLSLASLWSLEMVIVGGGVSAKGSFAMLRCLSLRSCPKLSYVFTCSMVNILPNLEELVIEDCVSLTNVVTRDDRTAGEWTFLPCLKVLKLHNLPNLIAIWRIYCPNVEYMSFYNCPKLKNLSMTSNGAAKVKEIAADKAWWDSLEWDEPVMFRRLDKLFNQIQLDDL